MTSLNQKFHNEHNVEEENILQKKVSSISFKEFYLQQNLQTSPYPLLKRETHLSYFMRIQQHLKRLTSSYNKDVAEKKEINDFVSDLIQNKKYNEINQFMKNGLSLKPSLISLLLNKTTRGDIDSYLQPLQQKDELYGIFAEMFFISSHTQIYCHKSLSLLAEKFPQEYISPDIFNKFSDYESTYKGVKLREINYDKQHGKIAIHMHNHCLNHNFSMNLFCHALQRAFLFQDFEYSSITWSIGSVLKVLLPYVKPYFSEDDKTFLFNLVEKNKNIMLKKGRHEELTSVLNNFYEFMKIQFQSTDVMSYQDLMLKKTLQIYGSNHVVSHQFLPLTIENHQFLDVHNTLIDSIKNMHKQFLGHDSILDNDNIDKVNHIIAHTLPITIEKYVQINSNFRDSIKNIEGKNANELFEESLTNILYTMQQVELDLEQAKVNALSIVNRQNRINKIH